MIIAKEKYPRISMGMLLQFRNIYEAVTILPTSNTEPIIIIGMNAAANIVVKPIMEYQAATTDIAIPTEKIKSLSILVLSVKPVCH